MVSNTSDRQCKRIRWYQRLFVGLFVLYIPVVFLIGVGLYLLLHTFTFLFALAGIWGVAFVVSFVLLVSSRCPNCNRRFVGRWPFTKKCAQCGFSC
jgi:hypothetical protein